MTTRAERADKAAETFCSGHSRQPYVLRKGITRGMSMKGNQQRSSNNCMKCKSLEDLKDVFDSFVHTGQP